MSDAADQIDATSACRTGAGKTNPLPAPVVTDAVDEVPIGGSVDLTGANCVPRGLCDNSKSAPRLRNLDSLPHSIATSCFSRGTNALRVICMAVKQVQMANCDRPDDTALSAGRTERPYPRCSERRLHSRPDPGDYTANGRLCRFPRCIGSRQDSCICIRGPQRTQPLILVRFKLGRVCHGPNRSMQTFDKKGYVMVDAPSVLVHISVVQTDCKRGQFRNLMIELLVG